MSKKPERKFQLNPRYSQNSQTPLSDTTRQLWFRVRHVPLTTRRNLQSSLGKRYGTSALRMRSRRWLDTPVRTTYRREIYSLGMLNGHEVRQSIRSFPSARGS